MALWPNSPFARPVSSFVSPVPVPGSDPLTGDCVAIRVNKAWLPYIVGSLQQLLLETTWNVEGTALAEVQGQAMNLILALADPPSVPCDGPFVPLQVIEESEYQMSLCEQLRFQDGKLQALCCGEWTDIPGQSAQGNPVSGQPGAGSPIPPPNGGTAKYCGGIAASTWLLPVPVSTGDTLLFSELGGAWKDSLDLIVWECPNGWNYALGHCWERLPLGAGDPLPTALHMQIVALINGVYYDCLQVDADGVPTTFTIPGGITNAQVELQANIDDLSRVQGDITFCVEVTNNELGTWSHSFDFTVSDFGWFPNRNLSTDMNNYCSYVPGVGFVAVEITIGPDNQVTSACYKTTPSGFTGTFTEIDVYYEVQNIDSSNRGEMDWVYVSNTTWDADLWTLTAGTPQVHTVVNANNRACTMLSVAVEAVNEPGSFPTTTSKITKLVVRGTGVDPF